MKKRKGHFLRRLIIGIIVLLIVLYAGVVGMVCIREGRVQKTVPAAEDYDAIIVLGAQVKPDGSPSVQLSSGKMCRSWYAEHRERTNRCRRRKPCRFI